MLRKRMTGLLTVLTGALVVFGLVGAARADLVVDDFNAGGADTGLEGSWTGTSVRNVVQTNDLTYANYLISQSGTEYVAGDASNYSHGDRADTRDLTAAMSGEIWFCVLVYVPGGSTYNFAGLSFHSDTLAESSADYSHNASDLRVLMSTNQLWVDWEGAAVNAAWTPDATAGSFAAGTTHLILGKMIVVPASGLDTIQVWVDPDLTAVSAPGGLPAADYSNTTIDFTDSIVRIGTPVGDGVGAGLDGDTVDCIYLSDTASAFYDVTGCSPPPAGTVFLIQ